MTRSIFDPEGGETEQSGNRNMGPAAGNISHMPPDVVDGKVSEEEVAEHEAASSGDPAFIGLAEANAAEAKDMERQSSVPRNP